MGRERPVREPVAPGGPPLAPLDDRDAERIADAMFALSNPGRVQILACLRAGPHAVTEIMDAIGMEQSAVSHQLRVLRDHGLVLAERQGRRRVYALHDEHVAALVDGARDHVAQLVGGRERRRARQAG